MDVSIIIRTRNEAEFIDATLRRILEQEFGGEYEVVVVDSESQDSTVEILRRYKVKLIQITQKEFTYGRSLNIGADNARGAFIVNLSAHALPRDKKWLASLVAGFEDDHVAGVYGRQLSNGRVNPFEALKSDVFFGEEKITFNMRHRKMLRQMHFSNSNSAIRKEVWQRFRFDEGTFYAEDVLWQTEVIKAGFSIVYAPDAAVYHTHSVSIHNAYKNSNNCAYALALMKRKRQSIALAMLDVGICLGLLPVPIFQNLRFIFENKHFAYLQIAPLYVVSCQLGWLVGRLRYRLEK